MVIFLSRSDQAVSLSRCLAAGVTDCQSLVQMLYAIKTWLLCCVYRGIGGCIVSMKGSDRGRRWCLCM